MLIASINKYMRVGSQAEARGGSSGSARLSPIEPEEVGLPDCMDVSDPPESARCLSNRPD